MKKYLLSILTLIFLALPVSAQILSNEELGIPVDETVSQQTPEVNDQIYFNGKVTEVKETGKTEADGAPYQILGVKILTGERKGEDIIIGHGLDFAITEKQLTKVGDRIVINEIREGEQSIFYVVDFYRLPAVWMLAGFFLLLTIIFAGFKGIRAVAGLIFSIAVIMYFILPQILAGKNPLLIALVGSIFIMIISLYLAHGFNRRSTISLVSISITLVITILLSELFINVAHLLGLGSEEAFLLQYDLGDIDLKGLLLGGIIIGTLGVLDDISTAQVAVVQELKHANDQLNAKDLYKRALRVGKEHIASLVNTLAMAYVGASLPLIILISVNLKAGIGIVINSELMVEEMARTLIGSTALVLAVPITTILAAWYFGERKVSHQDLGDHTH